MTLSICSCGGDIGQPASQHDISCPLAIEPDPMTPKQYADAIARLGLSQRAAGSFLGVDERQSRRWIAGENGVPESVAKLLRLMIRFGLSPKDVT